MLENVQKIVLCTGVFDETARWDEGFALYYPDFAGGENPADRSRTTRRLNG
jgi:hypothetical protein